MAVELIGLATLVVQLGVAIFSGRAPERPGRSDRRPLIARSVREVLGVRSLLRASSVVTSDAVRQRSRIPLEFNERASALSKLLHPLQSFFLRPSSSKSVFAIRDWGVTGPALDATGSGGFAAGGFVLSVAVAPQEDRGHLLWSLRSGAFQSARIVVICSPDAFASPFVKHDCYCINAAAAKKGAGDDRLLHLPSSIDQRIGVERIGKYTRDELPTDAMWLVHVPDADGAVDVLGGLSKSERSRWLDPMRLRVVRYVGYGIVLLSVAMTLVLADRSVSDGAVSPGPASLTMWSIFVLLGVPYCSWNFWRWRVERRKPCGWVARTSRCLEDGHDLMNGYAWRRMDELTGSSAA